VASNFFSGLLLKTHIPYKEGDWIEIDDKYGEVQNVGWLTTTIKNINGQEVSIPNQIIYTGTFTIDDYSFLENGTGVAVHWKSENPEEDALVRKYATLPATSENPTHVTRGAHNPNYIVRENIKLPSMPNIIDKKNEGNYYTLSIYHVKNQ